MMLPMTEENLRVARQYAFVVLGERGAIHCSLCGDEVLQGKPDTNPSSCSYRWCSVLRGCITITVHQPVNRYSVAVNKKEEPAPLFLLFLFFNSLCCLLFYNLHCIPICPSVLLHIQEEVKQDYVEYCNVHEH